MNEIKAHLGIKLFFSTFLKPRFDANIQFFWLIQSTVLIIIIGYHNVIGTKEREQFLKNIHDRNSYEYLNIYPLLIVLTTNSFFFFVFFNYIRI